MRERLARALFVNLKEQNPINFVSPEDEGDMRSVTIDGHFDLLKAVDALLAELREPDEGMQVGTLKAMNSLGVVMEDEARQHNTKVFQAMIDAITGAPDRT